MATKKTAKKGVPAKKKGHGSMGMKVGVTVATGVAAALAGAYLMYAKSAAPQRKQAKAWMAKARKDVARELGKLKHVSAAQYAEAVDKAMKRYASMKEASIPELLAAAKEMKAEWKHIQAHAKNIAKASGGKKPAKKK
jgi:hypothetical protein